MHCAFFLFLASGRLSTSHRCFPYRTPPLISPSLSFLSSFGDMTARTPASSSGPPLLSFISPSAARAGSAPYPRPYLHSMYHLCISYPPHPLLVCCFPSPFAYIRYPWSKKGSSSSKKFKFPFWVVNLRVHNVLLLSRLFLDLLVLRHVLDNHYLVVSPLPSSISTSGLSLGCIRLLLTMYP